MELLVELGLVLKPIVEGLNEMKAPKFKADGRSVICDH